VGALGIYVVSSVDVFSKQLPVYQKNLNQQAAILINWLSKHGLENIFDINILNELGSSKIMKFIGGLITSLGAVFANMFMIQLTAIFILFESYVLPKKNSCRFWRV
jgi:predicted PurR-regulated permease PerM